MPYIAKVDRKKYDVLVDELAGRLEGAPIGEANYVISRMIWSLFKRRESYTLGNNLIGVLHCVAQEFYRRMVAPYEDQKLKENGDVEV